MKGGRGILCMETNAKRGLCPLDRRPRATQFPSQTATALHPLGLRLRAMQFCRSWAFVTPVVTSTLFCRWLTKSTRARHARLEGTSGAPYTILLRLGWSSNDTSLCLPLRGHALQLSAGEECGAGVLKSSACAMRWRCANEALLNGCAFSTAGAC
jgi:hypothetical protein